MRHGEGTCKTTQVGPEGHDGRDASAVLPDVPTGMHLAAAEGLDPLILAIAPSETGRRKAIRHYRIIG